MSAAPVTLDMTTAQPIQAAPVKIDMSTAQPIDSAGKRLGSNFISGMGVTSNEQAKNFFTHPLDTVIKSFEAQGELAKKARDAYDRGDYMEALQHGLNYMVPFIGQQTDQAGTQLKEGDIAGGVGRTLGAAVPIAAGSPELQAGATDAVSAASRVAARGVRAAARGANAGLEKAPGLVGGAAGAALGHASGIPEGGLLGALAGKEMGNAILPKVRIPGEGFGLPSRITGGPAVIPPDLPPGEAGSMAESVAQPPQTPAPAGIPPSGETIPRTLSGDSALRQVLGGQDNANLMKIAKSRGINVTKEAQLKPGVADNLLINKIVDDFSDEELSNMRDTYLESTRMGRHNFGDIGAEAQKTLSMKTYFPDVKVPAATLKRVQAAIAGGTKPAAPAPPAEDYVSILQESLRRAQAAKANQ